MMERHIQLARREEALTQEVCSVVLKAKVPEE